MKFFLLITIILMLVFSLNAQEWDEITDDELAMRDFPDYHEADAVILFDIGQLKITKDFELEIKRHVRIKILTEEGKESADISFSFRDHENIIDLEAHAYSPDGEEYELDDDDVHYQEYDDWNICRFSIPGVEVGSVIEYRYEVLSEYIHYLDPWYFQNDKFTVLSQLSVAIRPGFNYTAFPENISLYDYQLDQEDYVDIDTRKKNRRFTWRARNIPPLKREKLMYNFDDYLAKVYFQLVSYKDSYQNYTFIKTWDDLSKTIHKTFENSIDIDDGLKDLTLNLLADASDIKEKIEHIYKFMLDSIETIDNIDLWDYETPEKVLENRRGIPSSKNLMLICMLRHANIESHPVMISTRPNGRIFLDIPQMRQFNHFLVQVYADNKLIYLDTSDEFCPQGVLSTDCSVKHGLLVKENKGQIVKIKSKQVKSLTQIKTDIMLNSGGVMVANSTFKLQGYPAFYTQGKMKSKTLQKYGEEKLNKSFEECILDTIWVEKRDNPEILVYHMKYEIKNFAEDAGDMLYLSAPFFTKSKTNPLKTEKRFYPVDYANTFIELESVNIHLADNMSILELPLRVKDNSRYASYSNFIFKGEKEIELNRQFSIKKLSFQPVEYKELRRIYNTMTNSDQNQIVIAVN